METHQPNMVVMKLTLNSSDGVFQVFWFLTWETKLVATTTTTNRQTHAYRSLVLFTNFLILESSALPVESLIVRWHLFGAV